MDFVYEFSEDGIFSEHYETVKKGEKIDMVALSKELQVKNQMVQIY